MMKRVYRITPPFVAGIAIAIATSCIAKEPEKVPSPVSVQDTNSTNKSSSISVLEMIETGPPQLKLHALAMLSQGKIQLKDSDLKTFQISAEDKNVPIRSVTAQIVGKQWIQKGQPENPEAIQLLLKLSRDTSEDVRYKSVYYGLANVENKSDAVIKRLIEIAGEDRESNLLDSIKAGLANDQDRVIQLLNKQLHSDDITASVSAFEIYADLTGQKAPNEERFLDLPSSRPMLFIFADTGDDAEALKANLTSELQKAGMDNPELSLSGSKSKQVIMLKTRLTKDRLLVEKKYADSYSQALWLSPQLEIQMEAMRNKK